MFLKITQNSQENTCARASFFACLRPATLFKKRPWRRCFPVRFAEFLLWIAYYYYYSCNSCNDIYYCKTKYHFCVRPANHKGVFTSYKESCRNIKQSAVLNHVTAHNFNKRG